MKPVFIDSAAEQELADSVAFYEGRRIGLGLDFEQAARAAIQTIQAYPELQALRKDGTRRYVMERFPFVIHYVELPGEVWILAFAHTSRKPGFWQDRL